MRRVDNRPIGVDGRVSCCRSKRVVSPESRQWRVLAQTPAHLRFVGRLRACHLCIFVAVIALSSVRNGERLPHHAVGVVAACHAAVFLGEAIGVTLHTITHVVPREVCTMKSIGQPARAHTGMWQPIRPRCSHVARLRCTVHTVRTVPAPRTKAGKGDWMYYSREGQEPCYRTRWGPGDRRRRTTGGRPSSVACRQQYLGPTHTSQDRPRVGSLGHRRSGNAMPDQMGLSPDLHECCPPRRAPGLPQGRPT